MSEPETQCVYCEVPAGTLTSVRMLQSNAHTLLGGPVTLVGAIPTLQAVAVARSNPDPTSSPNPACTNPHYFHDVPILGPILFVKSDQYGNPVDLGLRELEAHLFPICSRTRRGGALR